MVRPRSTTGAFYNRDFASGALVVFGANPNGVRDGAYALGHSLALRIWGVVPTMFCSSVETCPMGLQPYKQLTAERVEPHEPPHCTGAYFYVGPLQPDRTG